MWLRFSTIKNLWLEILFNFKGTVSQEIPLDSVVTPLIFSRNRKLQYQNTAEPTHLLATLAVGAQSIQDVPAEHGGGTWCQWVQPANWSASSRDKRIKERKKNETANLCPFSSLCEVGRACLYFVWGQRFLINIGWQIYF